MLISTVAVDEYKSKATESSDTFLAVSAALAVSQLS